MPEMKRPEYVRGRRIVFTNEVIVDPDGGVTVTNDGATILEKMMVENQAILGSGFFSRKLSISDIF